MKKGNLLLMITLFFGVTSFASTNLDALEKQFKETNIIIAGHAEAYGSIANIYGLEVENVIAVVYPELVRSTHFDSRIEKASEGPVSWLIYKQLGMNMGDLSRGLFQMKVCFAEDVESSIQRVPELLEKFSELLVFESNDSGDQRKERWNRMGDPIWQFRYACAYYAYMEWRFSEWEFPSHEEKISFFSNAYNLGPSASSRSILDLMQVRHFPYGSDSEKSVTLGEASNHFLKVFADDLFSNSKPDISTGEVTDIQNKKLK